MSKTLSIIVVLGVVAVVLPGLLGCGGSKGQNGDGGSEGDIVVAQGRISSRGGTPFSLLVLEATGGKLYMIEPSYLADELRSLDGMDVSLRARLLPQAEDENLLIDVIDYDLLRLPSGEAPIVGYVRQGGMIEDTTGIVWILDGDFKDVIGTFVGAKLWVVGVPMQSIDRPEATYRVLLVTEYGVIRP